MAAAHPGRAIAKVSSADLGDQAMVNGFAPQLTERPVCQGQAAAHLVFTISVATSDMTSSLCPASTDSNTVPRTSRLVGAFGLA
jgi:hypothetical protein